MKRLITILTLVFCTAFNIQAQKDDSYNYNSRRAQLSTDSMNVDVLVIPANSRLYNSFFDREMIAANSMDFNSLRDTILSSLAYQIAAAFNDSTPSGIIPESKSGYKEDMNFVYESIDYTYKLVPEPKKKESSFNKWKKKISKKDTKPEPKKGTYMEGGQIVSNPEVKPQYTSIEVLNSDFLYILNKRYHANAFVFVNHYEMIIPNNVSHVDIQSDNYPRIIKVHYTIVDVNGKEINSGLITHNSSSYDNKLDYLIGSSFYQIGSEIFRAYISVK